MTTPTVELKVPSVGESVTEVEIGDWLKQPGDPVRKDETVVVLETDKATVEIPAPVSGRLAQTLRNKGDRVRIGDVIGHVEPGAEPDEKPAQPADQSPKPADQPRIMPAAARLMAEKGIKPQIIQPSGPGGRVLKEDVEQAAGQTPVPAGPAKPAGSEGGTMRGEPGRREQVVPMTLLRRKVAERLVQAQHNAALLTTFNEIDMSAVRTLRKEYQDRFQDRYQVKLGFMSFFVKAAVEALKITPQLNAEIRDTNIVYRDFFDIGIAIGGGRGLVVPVLRNAEYLSFAEIEQAIAEFARKARDNKLRPEDLQGGTFTITNGGVYGSLLSTPLINPPQSGVLGMHSIQDRPVAINDQIAIRPMMYIALSYDHRIVDGREAVTFLRRIKELVENPVRILIEV